MQDLTVSLIVIGLTGVLIAGIFLALAKRQESEAAALAAYCSARGYRLTVKKERLSGETLVESDAFLMRSTRVSRVHEAQTGAAGWDVETVWETKLPVDAAPAFALGSVPSAGNWERLPDMVKAAAVEQMRRETRMAFPSGGARPIQTAGGKAFLVFTQNPGEAEGMAISLLPLLDAFPKDARLVLLSGPEKVVIRQPDHFVKKVSDAQRLIRLGFACAGLPPDGE